MSFSCGSAVEPTPVELIMREVNLRIFEFGSEHHVENELFSFFCECGNPNCDRKISLHLHRSRREYEVAFKAVAQKGADAAR